ncbi:MarR family winged helix-turn-helix transcriptional regulator [Leifsonia flava]|uniref:MarR family transcriptional regulator n=1 Tax=Orlajensenia leifsoniae TaxID=2561933 RepID=A0A4Y9QRL2_9MICO|nr:MarR family transcriptional regulator [Leifsonia flava]TFV95171.1 MarR family transcriptional regulator [Leifsonia flava]
MSTTPNHSEGFSWRESLPYVLWRADNAVNRHLLGAIKDLGVNVTQLGLAVHLDELGPLSASDLSRGIHVTPQSVATALSRLDKIGWVEHQPHPVHGRVVLFTITDRGREGVREGTARMAKVTDRLTGTLSSGGADHLIVELRRILLDLEGSDRPMEALWPIRDA